MDSNDFDSIEFVRDYDESKLESLRGQMLQIELDGRSATYLFEPDQYSLEVLIKSENYSLVGSTNYDKISQSVPQSLKHFEVPIGATVLVVASEYNADYYIKAA